MNQQDSSGASIVNKQIFYYKIKEDTPRGQRCILINKQAGVGIIGELNKSNESFFDHWYPMPVFLD